MFVHPCDLLKGDLFPPPPMPWHCPGLYSMTYWLKGVGAIAAPQGMTRKERPRVIQKATPHTAATCSSMLMKSDLPLFTNCLVLVIVSLVLQLVVKW